MLADCKLEVGELAASTLSGMRKVGFHVGYLTVTLMHDVY